MKAIIFDLDGVVVDTAKYHYLAWKEIGARMGIDLLAEHAERQKGVSRMASLEVLLEAGGIVSKTEEEKIALADEKNRIYLDMIQNLTEENILPGIPEFLTRVKRDGCKIALGSASKSGEFIIEKLGLRPMFDVIVDGNLVEKPKPDPQVFLQAQSRLQVPAKNCLVIEDAKAGVRAALAAKMHVMGIGTQEQLFEADAVLCNTELLAGYDYESLFV